MIVWTGLGFLVAVITFGTSLLFNLALDAQFGEGYYSSHNWAPGAALVIGGIISSVVGFLLRNSQGRAVIDAQTGERFVLPQSHHSFFFVPMHWAGLAVAVIGLGIALYDVIT